MKNTKICVNALLADYQKHTFTQTSWIYQVHCNKGTTQMRNLSVSQRVLERIYYVICTSFG